MFDSRSTLRIGVFGHVGTKNLGDEAIITAVIQNIRRRYPEAEIRGFTFNPEDTRRRHEIVSFPIRQFENTSLPANQQNDQAGTRKSEPQFEVLERVRAKLKRVPWLLAFLKATQRVLSAAWRIVGELGFLIQSYRNLKGTDVLIVAGSGQLTDHSGGPWAYPYTLFKWSALAKACGTRIAFASVGSGWIRSPLSRFLLRRALSTASYRSFRDESSRRVIEQLGVTSGNLVVPDLAYSLQLPRAIPASSQSSSSPIVGINPVPFFHKDFWHQADMRLYEDYVRTMAEFATWLARKRYRILLIPTQVRADLPPIRDISQLLKSQGNADVYPQILDLSIRSLEDLVAGIAKTDLMVPTRYHGVLLSILLHKPVLGVAYHEKTSDLMSQVGQSEYTLDIRQLRLDTLREKFNLMESRKDTIRRELEQRVPICQKAVEAQYDRIFGQLEARSGIILKAREEANAR